MVIAIVINVLDYKYLKSVGQLSDDKNIYVSLYVGREKRGNLSPNSWTF
jgi:hypothetical protein